uniref:Uncharacterized protein n=1 Tax=Cyclophora tenuis TaxID=216820 RepID=A0A7S1GNB5_CYCTE
MNGVPVKSEEIVDDEHDPIEEVYPIAVDRTKDTLRNLLLPFMNLAVMKLTAGEPGLRGLARLLGLPETYGIPNSWKKEEVGLVHNPDKPSTIAEFAVLHDVMRRQELSSYAATAEETGLQGSGLGEIGKEMERLEDFFRDHDPVRTFSGLHRVSDGRDGSPAIWTTEAEVSRIEGELELASVEHKLRELKKEWIKKQRMQDEIASLTNQIKLLQSKSSKAPSEKDGHVKNENAQRRSPSFSNSNWRQETHGNPGGAEVVPDPERPMGARRTKREKKRKKMRIRPYFGVC